jgi:hypothetical protein
VTAKNNVATTAKEDLRDQKRHPTNLVVTAAMIDMIIETRTTEIREDPAMPR